MPTVSYAPLYDSYVQEDFPFHNYGSEGFLLAGFASSAFVGSEATGICRIFLQYDLSALPMGITITSATLQVICWATYDHYTFASFSVNNCSNAWTESTITWNNAPSAPFSSGSFVTTAGGVGFDPNTLDVTFDVTTAYNNNDGAVSWRIASTAESQDYFALATSKEYNSTLAPHLTITYTGGATRRRGHTILLTD